MSSKPKRKFNENDMQEAVKCVREGTMSCKGAAKKFNLNRTTIMYRVSGHSKKSTMGPECYLGNKAEEILVHWILTCQKAKFPITSDELIKSVEQLVKKMKLKTVFKNDRPGKKWLKLFLTRHPGITYRTPEYLSQCRANITPTIMENWFKEVEQYLKDNNYTNILKDPSRIFNCDESCFYLNPKGKKVLAAKGERDVHQICKDSDKENYRYGINHHKCQRYNCANNGGLSR